MRLIVLLLALGMLGGVVMFAALPTAHHHDVECAGEPLPPDLLDITQAGMEIIVAARPVDAGELQVAVSTEGPASLIADAKTPLHFSTAGSETRRYRFTITPGKPDQPPPAAVIDATLIVDGITVMSRTYRIPFRDEPAWSGPDTMPPPVPDGRGGTVRVFPGVSQ